MSYNIDALIKHAGILNPPKDHLAPKVWSSDMRLQPQVAKEVKARIYTILPEEQVKAIFILGSITGYKWDDCSDIDVMVAICDYDESKKKTRLTATINDKPMGQTTHDINYFIVEYHEGIREGLRKHDWGVYDVFNDRWIASPGDPDLLRNPDKQFYFELQYAKSKAREFERLAEQLNKIQADIDGQAEPIKSDMLQYSNYKNLTNSKKQAYERLADFVLDIDKQRKIDYSSSFGVARIGLDNIVFKYIEHGPNAELFNELKKYNSERKNKR